MDTVMNPQAVIDRAEMRGPFGYPQAEDSPITRYVPSSLMRFSGAVDEKGVIHISGITREALLRSLAMTSHGRLISSDNLKAVVREVSRLCNEHDSPDVIGFDDLSCAMDKALDDQEASEARSPVYEDPRIEMRIQERKALHAAFDHLAGAN